MIALLKKELRTALRDKTGQALLGSMLFLLILFGFMTLSSGRMWSEDPLMASQAGRDLLATGLYSQMVAVILILPALAAINLVREGERKTLETLLTTPQDARNLLMAKLLWPVVLTAYSVILALPVLTALAVLGGVRFYEPWIGAIAVLMVATVASALGLAIGSLSRNTAASVLISGLTSGMVLAITTPIGLESSQTVLGAALPMGFVSALLQDEAVRAFRFQVPILVPIMFLFTLVSACLFHAALPSLTTPYRRRCIPVRLFGAGALLLIMLLGVASLRPEHSASSAANVAAIVLGIATFGSLVLLGLERFDTVGFLRPMKRSAESAGAGVRYSFEWFASSRLTLALLPWLAGVPVLALLVGSEVLQRDSFAYGAAIGLGAIYTFFWVLFCHGASGLVAHRGRRWWEFFGSLCLPAGLLILSFFTAAREFHLPLVGLQPIRVVGMVDELTRVDDLFLAVITIFAAAAVMQVLAHFRGDVEARRVAARADS